MDTDNYTQPLEAVMREERQRVYPMPLKVGVVREEPKGDARNRAYSARNRRARASRLH